MATSQPTLEEKNAVRDFWNADPCGTRYLEDNHDYVAHANARYALESHIWEFADFACGRGKRVLEIGVGMGADYLEWLKAGARATGVDLSSASLVRARERCRLAGYDPELRVEDAEHLSFSENTFDVVYSYGVLHHSPDTRRCLREAWRVLKPGGQLKIMLYHHPSLTGLMLWLRFGVLQRKSLRETVFEHLESPGTKSFTRDEVREMLAGFANVRMQQALSPGDLLLHRPSARFRGWLYRVLWRMYPTTIVRHFCRGYGLFLLVEATKIPASE
jgi:ubiquinone/menaquinone biosynthesis C-methylase UbiE